MSGEVQDEPDRIGNAPHPRETPRLFGQAAAEAAFLDAYTSGRLHHGWLLTGPRGVGKATFAWRIARFLLAEPAADGAAGGAGLFGAPTPPATLDIAPDHPVARRVAALSEGRLFLLRRAWDSKKKRLKTVITVEEARKLKDFFSLSAADGGRRVVIVDTADEMNPNAANALLKVLEEPPTKVTLLLISHRPTGLLPTIRSRCRELRLVPVGADDMAAALAQAGVDPADGAGGGPGALAELAAGSVGEAIHLSAEGGQAIYAAVVALLASAPGMSRPRALDLAERAAARGAEGRFDLVLRLLELALARLARAGTTGRLPPEACPGEAAMLARLAPGPEAGRAWAELHQGIGNRARQGKAVNLDPAALVLDMCLRMDETATAWAARRTPA